MFAQNNNSIAKTKVEHQKEGLMESPPVI